MTNEQKKSTARKAASKPEKLSLEEIFERKELFEELSSFLDNKSQGVFLLHLRYAFAAYAKDSPQSTQDAFETYGELVELINAISSSKNYIERKFREYARFADELPDNYDFASGK